MRKLIVLPLLVAGSFAGTAPVSESAKSPAVSAKSAKMPITPTPSPNLLAWFAGGTAGLFVDSECEFFSAHVGRDLNRQLWGWDTAAYLEVGFFSCDHSMNKYDDKYPYKYDDKYDDKKYDEQFERAAGTSENGFRAISYDLDVVPVTLNYKLERQITQSLNAYVGVGAGVAFADLSTNMGTSDDDTVFFAQAFAGVLHNVTETFEVYAGGRLIYLDEPSFDLGGGSTSLDDAGFDLDEVDGLVEIGARFNF